ncbi:hypothetical protein B0A54_12877 [Friedmanniomyces endolithicus]|uniref:Uncharacterized protein n=1 Tax=Friedmanniomyces endolithicus TaxID=329885 RepID=A0A4U0UJ87_9PEZI|nr:hypothetical protein LTS09_001007 [Friedmanniomyces endolithicus]TKA35708.1 hypothetical protein B0A54_12877 [Friedmanniomyces endolithicus]
MASSIPLHLFPSATTYPPPPRKSSLKKPTPIFVAQPQGQLRGLALQVSTGPASPPRILPATDTYKHSLFCEPSTVTVVDQSSPGLPRRQHARRRTSRPDSLIARSPGLPAEITATQNEDRLSPLPINAQFGSSPRPSRTSSKHLIRPTVPNAIVVKESVGAEPTASADDDQLSPLPEKIKFSPPSPRLPEYSGAPPQRSANWPTRSTSAATHKTTKSPALHAPMKSIFPEYDSGRPLDQQAYYPTNQAYAQSLPSAKVSKASNPIRRPSIKRFDSALALVDGYEHIPFAETGDLLSLWKASNDQFPVAGRKVQLSLHQPTTRDTAITVGASANERLFSMSRTPAQSSAGDAKHWTVEKHEGSHDGVAVPVAQLAVRAQSASDDKSQAEGTAIFPQAAAVHAIEAVANSAAAAAIATFDPTAASPQAARLGKDAVAEAHRRYACVLTRTTRKRDSLGAVTACYNLDHPLLGTLAITVTKKMKSAMTREPRAKISIHHPSATPAAIAADTLVLAFLDFSRDACVLDLPALLALDSFYIIDTTITALFAVAAIENSLLQSETMTFDPPPKQASHSEQKSSQLKRKKSERWAKRSSRVIDKVQAELIGQPADVGAPVQGAIKFIGFSLKTAAYVLDAGVRVVVRLANKV